MNIEDNYNIVLDPGPIAAPDAQLARLVSPGNLDLKQPWAGALTDPDTWKAKVRSTLREVESKWVGQLLLNAIKSTGKGVFIEPYWRSPLGGFETALMGHLRDPLNAETDITLRILHKRVYKSLMRISPERYDQISACCAQHRGDDVLKEGHEVMFHELVHSLRQCSGTKGSTKAIHGGLKDYGNAEEFYAVVITNIYASWNGKTRLRANHLGHGVLAPEFMDSFKFYEQSTLTFELIERFYNENTDFANTLGALDAKHNPFRAFWLDREKARRCSQSPKARARDAH
jgi:hypothetical protein